MEINNIRKDWALEKLGDFADYEKGKKPKNQSPIQTEIFKYPYVNIQAFEKGIIDEYTDGEKCNFCSENDFLMVWDGSRFGLIGKGIKGAIGSTLMKINFPGIENHFAYYFLKSKYLEINSKPKGTGTPHVNPELLWNYIFPIAPLPEQRAIVSKIEQLFSDLDNGIENFKKAQAQLKLYRQSVLKAACEGKLVTTEAELARAEGRDYEAVDVLLARILKERREKWNGKGNYKELLAPDTSGLLELPEGWCWVTMEQISTKVVDGVHKKPNYVTEGIPFITVRNLTAGQGISFEKVRYITEEDHKDFCKRANPEKGDILITKDGTLGIARTIKTENMFSIFVSVAMIKPIKNYLNCDYIETYLNSPIGQRQTEKMGEGSGLRHLHLEDLRVMVFPLPPLAEQRRIVAEVERRLSVCDKMEATISESLQKAESLRQSILKKAFEGKLLNKKELEKARNAPDWEPAEKLLERIRQEKAQIGEKKRKR